MYKTYLKRIIDFILAFFGILFLSPILIVIIIILCIENNCKPFFFQKRIGQFGKPFTTFKLRTMYPNTHKVSKTGVFLRKYKLDELPQLINILKGEMNIVGPRPDVVGYYDKLEGENRKILELKPGLTSKAAIKYSNEEELLKQQTNPTKYNNEVLFPDKVRMNLEYYYNHTFFEDIKIIFQTFRVLF